MTVRELLDGYDTMKSNICVNILGTEGAWFYGGDAKEIQDDDGAWEDEEVVKWWLDTTEDGNGLYDELNIVIKREEQFELTDEERHVLVNALRRMDYLEELCLAEENKAVAIFENCGLPDNVTDRIREHIYDVQGRTKAWGVAMQSIETEIWDYNTNL